MLNQKTLHDTLLQQGYHVTKTACLDLFLAIQASKNPKMGLSGVLLSGPAGCGKTALVEALSKVLGAKMVYYQAVPSTGSDQLLADINVPAILKQDHANVYQKGCLIRAAELASSGQRVILFIDELDKARLEVDAFLLDFLQSGRITGTCMGDVLVSQMPNLLVFVATNKQRELQDPLLSRLRDFKMELPTPSFMAKILKSRFPDGSCDMINWICGVYEKQLQIQSQLSCVLSIREGLWCMQDDCTLLEFGVGDPKERIEALSRNWLLKREDDQDRMSTLISSTEFVQTNSDRISKFKGHTGPSISLSVKVLDRRTPGNMPNADGYVEMPGVLLPNPIVRGVMAKELDRKNYSEEKLIWGAYLLESQGSVWKLFWNDSEPVSLSAIKLILAHQVTPGVVLRARIATTKVGPLEFKRAMAGVALQEAQVGETESAFQFPTGDFCVVEEGSSDINIGISRVDTLDLLAPVLHEAQTSSKEGGKEEYW